MNTTERKQLVADVTAAVLAVLDERDRAAKPAPKARKASQPKAAAKPAKCLTRKTRPAFVKAAGAWAQGLSTQTIAAMCVEDPRLIPAGWAIGEGYQAMFA